MSAAPLFRRRASARAAAEHGIPLADPDAREIVYGMPFKEWQAKYQKEASADQKASFAKANPGH